MSVICSFLEKSIGYPAELPLLSLVARVGSQLARLGVGSCFLKGLPVPRVEALCQAPCCSKVRGQRVQVQSCCLVSVKEREKVVPLQLPPVEDSWP